MWGIEGVETRFKWRKMSKGEAGLCCEPSLVSAAELSYATHTAPTTSPNPHPSSEGPFSQATLTFPPFLSVLFPAWLPDLFSPLLSFPIISAFKMLALFPCVPHLLCAVGTQLKENKTTLHNPLSFLQAGSEPHWSRDCLLSTLSKQN